MNLEFRWALGFVVPYWRRLLLVVLLSLVSTGLALALPYLSKALIDRALIARDVDALYSIVGLFAAASLVGFVLTAAAGLRYTRVSAEILFDMRLALYRHLQRLSPRFYARTPLGDILARVNNDIGEIQRVAAESLLAWVGNVLFLAGSIAAMCWLDWRLALMALAVVPLSVAAVARMRQGLAARIRTLREASAHVGSFLIESLQAMRLIVVSNAQEREVGRFRGRNDGFIAALMAMQLWSYLAGSAPNLILSLGSAAVFVYGGQRVIDGTLTLGTFVAFLAYQMRLLQPVQALMGLYTNLATVRVSLKRVRELFDAAPEVNDARTAVTLPQVKGAIAFESVSVDLGRGQLLRLASFAVAPGEVVALVGASGSGKSTIADLLVRLIDPDEGSITLDGHDLRAIALADVRHHIGLVEQVPIVFHTSIAENIRFGHAGATEADVRAAATAAGLMTFVDRSPDGLETIVGERGAALSAGERQRLALARALVANPMVLVLDEPTSSLDPATEGEALSGYSRARQGLTTIVITHRQAVVDSADRVLILTNDGCIEEASPQPRRHNAIGSR